MKESYTNDEVADLLEQAEKLKIPLYANNTIKDIEFLVNQELKKFTSKQEKYE